MRFIIDGKELIITILQSDILIVFLLIGLRWFLINKEYKNESYYQITHFSYLRVKSDLGKHGEYLIYQRLKDFEKIGAKFLFNVYVPKENGEFSEIDVIMICSKGLFVFESKNYSGWIFGNEKQLYWYQTLPKGRGKSQKEKFYNPIMQNRNHIKNLRNYLNEDTKIYSLIVFSERCTLKKVTVNSDDVKVINRHRIKNVVNKIIEKNSNHYLSEDDVARIYNNLYVYTQLSDDEKTKHVLSINNALDKKHKR